MNDLLGCGSLASWLLTVFQCAFLKVNQRGLELVQDLFRVGVKSVGISESDNVTVSVLENFRDKLSQKEYIQFGGLGFSDVGWGFAWGANDVVDGICRGDTSEINKLCMAHFIDTNVVFFDIPMNKIICMELLYSLGENKAIFNESDFRHRGNRIFRIFVQTKSAVLKDENGILAVWSGSFRFGINEAVTSGKSVGMLKGRIDSGELVG